MIKDLFYSPPSPAVSLYIRSDVFIYVKFSALFIV